MHTLEAISPFVQRNFRCGLIVLLTNAGDSQVSYATWVAFFVYLYFETRRGPYISLPKGSVIHVMADGAVAVGGKWEA